MEYTSSLQHGFDEQKPSLFEILSENQLAGLIPPSLRYLLTIATHRRPRYLLRVLNSYDELYALLMLALERYYLKTYGGCFTEHFYGLKREKVVRIKGGEAPRARLGAPELMRETLQLTDSDIWNNLALIVGLPYLKHKLDESYEIHVPQAAIIGPRYNRDALPPNPTIRQSIVYYYKWFLRKLYPSINAAYYFSLLAFNLGYLFDTTKYSSPFLWLMGIRLRRLSSTDHRAIALAEAGTSTRSTGARPGQGNSIFHPSTLRNTALGSLKLLLPTSIFALKFLEWYHASDFARQLSKKATEGLDLPPPIISGLPPPQTLPPLPTETRQQTGSKVNTVALSSSPSDSNPASIPTAPPPSQASNQKPKPPISATSGLLIYTVPPPSPQTSAFCPICLHDIVTPTAAGTGFVYCYTCIFKWVQGTHERQAAFMEGNGGGEAAWDGETEDDSEDGEDGRRTDEGKAERREGRKGKWESGNGRDAVTGRRVLGGTDGLRRVMA